MINKLDQEILEVLNAFKVLPKEKVKEYLVLRSGKADSKKAKEIDASFVIKRLLSQKQITETTEGYSLDPRVNLSNNDIKVFTYYLNLVKEKGSFIQIDKARYPLDYVAFDGVKQYDILAYDDQTGFPKFNYLAKMDGFLPSNLLLLRIGKAKLPNKNEGLDFSYEIIEL